MKQNLNEIKKMQRIAGLISEEEYRQSLIGIIKEGIQQSLEGLSKEEVKEKMEEIQDQIYNEATPEEIDNEENSLYGDKLWDRTMERFEMKFGINYWDALKQAESPINESNVNNSYVVKDEELSDEDGDFYVIDKQKALDYLSQFDSEDINAEQFINDDEGWGEFEQYLEDVEQMTDKEIEDSMRQEMSYYFFSKPDEI
jgi:hypothetical protein